jgi:hypothetical protein
MVEHAHVILKGKVQQNTAKHTVIELISFVSSEFIMNCLVCESQFQ